MHRGRDLPMYGKTESNKHFLQYVDKIEIDEEKIEAKVRIPLHSPASGVALVADCGCVLAGGRGEGKGAAEARCPRI